MRDKRPRIIDVVRKPRKCPVCGERVVDIGLSHRGVPYAELFAPSCVPFFDERSDRVERVASVQRPSDRGDG